MTRQKGGAQHGELASLLQYAAGRSCGDCGRAMDLYRDDADPCEITLSGDGCSLALVAWLRLDRVRSLSGTQ